MSALIDEPTRYPAQFSDELFLDKTGFQKVKGT